MKKKKIKDKLLKIKREIKEQKYVKINKKKMVIEGYSNDNHLVVVNNIITNEKEL